MLTRPFKSLRISRYARMMRKGFQKAARELDAVKFIKDQKKTKALLRSIVTPTMY